MIDKILFTGLLFSGIGLFVTKIGIDLDWNDKLVNTLGIATFVAIGGLIISMLFKIWV